MNAYASARTFRKEAVKDEGPVRLEIQLTFGFCVTEAETQAAHAGRPYAFSDLNGPAALSPSLACGKRNLKKNCTPTDSRTRRAGDQLCVKAFLQNEKVRFSRS